LAGGGGGSLLALKTSGICADDPRQEPIGFSVFFPSSSIYLMVNEIHKFDRDAGVRVVRDDSEIAIFDPIAFRDS
jgi:hypothetical protein